MNDAGIHIMTEEEIRLAMNIDRIRNDPKGLDPAIRLVVLNGPPGSGKDYYANSLDGKADVFHMKLSAPLKTIVGAAAGTSIADISSKQDKLTFNGKTLRQQQIDLFFALAEQFGDDILGKLLLTSMRQTAHGYYGTGIMPVFLTSDGRRGPEIQAIVDELGTDNVMVIQVERDGYTWDDDIGKYVELEGVHTVRIKNDDGEVYKRDVSEAISSWLVEWYGRHKDQMYSMGFGAVGVEDTETK